MMRHSGSLGKGRNWAKVIGYVAKTYCFEHLLTWYSIQVREATSDIQNRLRSMKFEVPTEGEEKITKKYEDLVQAMNEQFASVSDD